MERVLNCCDHATPIALPERRKYTLFDWIKSEKSQLEQRELSRPGKRRIMMGETTTVGTLIVATIYLQLIQNRYMFRSFTVLQCSHQHCVQPVTSDLEVVGYL